MDGAQDVILNLDDDEANQKKALRICYQCDDLLLKYGYKVLIKVFKQRRELYE